MPWVKNDTYLAYSCGCGTLDIKVRQFWHSFIAWLTFGGTPFWRRVCMTDFMGINCVCIESTVPSVIPWSGGKFNDRRDALKKYRAHRSKSLCAPTSVDVSECIKRTYIYVSRKNPWKCDRLNGRAKYFWGKIDLSCWKEG